MDSAITKLNYKRNRFRLSNLALGSEIIRKDAVANRHKIIQTAKTLFEQRGVEAVSMTEIARHAEIGVGTLYRNYQDKSELCMEVFMENIHIFVDANNQYLDQATNALPQEVFTRVLNTYFEFKDDNMDILNQVESSVRLSLGFYRDALYDQLNRLFQRVLRLKNPSDDETTLQFKADMLFAMLRNKEYIFQLQDRGLSKTAFIKRLIDMF